MANEVFKLNFPSTGSVKCSLMKVSSRETLFEDKE